MKTKDHLEPFCSHECMYIGFIKLKDSKGHNDQVKTTDYLRDTIFGYMECLSALGTIASL